ncbi:lipopolysaccharide biosynthesis protein [Demequina sp. SYSU T00192]|uniref:Lipopolysaccharide biosynthesis protein n=1 Tax=Demequina litoralis TaxID=3051660 RepID=A0ABT8G8G5_9MICO|nr:lipopolysaccharide biosynthesis protein [Demequina sp. SYSU T00192]MDN4475430.1 lipopolysaccharide biosynthesis protein [Demequina sp. SYSU T00192]
MTAPSLASSASRGASITLAGQLLRTGTSTIGLVVLARLLSPQDFGLVAMVAAVVGLGEVVRDLGLSTASIQARQLSGGQRSNLFWLSTSIGIALSVIIGSCASAIAGTYDEPRLAAIVPVLAATFTLNALGAQHRALANREMAFGKLAVIETAPPIVGLLVACVLAALGASYWSLVAQQVTIAALGAILAWLLVRWRPGMYARSERIGHLLTFGGNLVAVQLLGYLSRSIDTVVMGVKFGASALGMYDRAFQLVMLPLNQLNAPATRVALPVLSTLQDDARRYARYVEHGQRMLLYPILAILGLMSAVAPDLIEAVLGSQWSPASTYMRILIVGAAAQAASYATYWIFLSHGRTASNLKFALATRPIVIGSIVLGSLVGPLGIPAGYSIGLLILWPIGYAWVRSYQGVDASRLLRSGAIGIAVYLPAAGVGAVVSEVINPGESPWVGLAIGMTSYAAVAVASVALVPEARETWRDLGRRAFAVLRRSR